jgi:hypothetical protein
MKPQIQASLLCGLFLLFAQCDDLAAQEPGQTQQTASDLPASQRLITALPPTNSLPVSAVAQGLMEWPASETLNSQRAHQDRSKTIPALFRQPKVGDAKPIRLGARTPQAACKEAEQWIRLVLKPQWVPDDLAVRLQPLQRDPASQSIIVCRYAIHGHALQINQSRGSMWVTIRPPKTNSFSLNTKDPGVPAFNTYFLNGDRMASLQGKETGRSATLRTWLPDYSTPVPEGALENWWGWRLWLTDGEAVAVFLNKCSEDSARNIMPDDPWF